MDQFERFRAGTPELVVVIALTTIAATLSVLGDLPWWRQFVPPALILVGCALLLALWFRRRKVSSVDAALVELNRAPFSASAIGLIAGIWSVSAFAETERYYCVVAPVFVAICALMAANCLSAAPHAALGAITTAFAPIVTKMLLIDNLGIRSIAVIMIIMGVMQVRLIYARFEDRIRTIGLELELRQLADTDPLTALDNRRAFDEKLAASLSHGNLTLVMIDLNQFKSVNDRFGHAAGDAILVEVSLRLRALFPNARSIARIGGDEFSIILEHDDADGAAQIIRAALKSTVTFEGNDIPMAASVGSAIASDHGFDEPALRIAADSDLYRDKTASPRSRTVGIAA